MRITSDKWKGEDKDGISFDKFIVTGYYYNSKKKFRMEYKGTPEGYYTAMAINLYVGCVWGITEDGRRKLIKRIYN